MRNFWGRISFHRSLRFHCSWRFLDIYNNKDNNNEGNTYMYLEIIEEMIWNLGEGNFRKGYRVFHLDQNRGFQSKDVNESLLHLL